MKIYINANCQAEALRHTLLEALPEADISAIQVHVSYRQEALDAASAFAEKADLVITQPVFGTALPPIFRSRNLEAIRRPGSEMVSFPSIYFKGQHHTLTQLRVDGRPVDIPAFPYHDGIIADLVLRGESDARILERLQSPDLFTGEAVETEARLSLEALRGREASHRIDIPVSALIETYFRDEPLFHVFNHPGRRIVAHVANQVLHLLGTRRRVPVEGPDYLNFPHHPILPSTARHLGGLGRLRDFDFHFATRRLSFADYVRTLTGRFRALPRDLLETAMVSTDGLAEMLARWHAAERAAPHEAAGEQPSPRRTLTRRVRALPRVLLRRAVASTGGFSEMLARWQGGGGAAPGDAAVRTPPQAAEPDRTVRRRPEG